jgi:hypothetical protein
MNGSAREVENLEPGLGGDAEEWPPAETPVCRAAELADLLQEKRSAEGEESRWLADASEGLFLVLEGVVLGLVLIAMKFHPALIALFVAWGLFHVLALIRRVRRQRIRSEAFRRGILDLRKGDYPLAAEDFAESLSGGSSEPAWIGRVYALGMSDDRAGALQAARDLYREHLVGCPETVLQRPEYRILVGEPGFRAIARRLESVLNGEASEVFHYLPGLYRRRMLQTAVGVVFVIVVAFFLTLALTLR